MGATRRIMAMPCDREWQTAKRQEKENENQKENEHGLPFTSN
jgi:hypothetical protein